MKILNLKNIDIQKNAKTAPLETMIMIEENEISFDWKSFYDLITIIYPTFRTLKYKQIDNSIRYMIKNNQYSYIDFCNSIIRKLQVIFKPNHEVNKTLRSFARYLDDRDKSLYYIREDGTLEGLANDYIITSLQNERNMKNNKDLGNVLSL